MSAARSGYDEVFVIQAEVVVSGVDITELYSRIASRQHDRMLKRTSERDM